MDLCQFVLARVAEEEQTWRDLGEQDEGFTVTMERGLRRCAEKRRAVKAYTKGESRPLLAKLQEYALVYYDHPDYDRAWRPESLRF